ncbi:MAG: GNAT family N-acetyltransferase [Clostridiaceae bacterium]|jgi:predicted GNAT family N-acyltransferase|nr:GNAT family N-acetyltransferase [Clostridiaceae bacterium]
MIFRQAENKDIDRIFEIIKQAQEYLRQKGIDQWQDNYPNLDIIKNDIENKECYVLQINDDIIATVVLSFKGEKSYNKIFEGKWILDKPYAVIHRIAVDNKYKGMRFSSVIMKHIENICLEKNIYSIRVDTHQDNESMVKMLNNNGFTYCGIIYLESGSRRIAFEKNLSI